MGMKVRRPDDATGAGLGRLTERNWEGRRRKASAVINRQHMKTTLLLILVIVVIILIILVVCNADNASTLFLF